MACWRHPAQRMLSLLRRQLRRRGRSAIDELHVHFPKHLCEEVGGYMFGEDVSWFSNPNICSCRTFPSRTLACTHKSSTSSCQIRPEPRRLAIPMAAHASLCTLTCISKPKSRATDCIPNAVDTPFENPCSSDSPLDRLIGDWVTLQCFTQ